jgi:hypothetical protein
MYTIGCHLYTHALYFPTHCRVALRCAAAWCGPIAVPGWHSLMLLPGAHAETIAVLAGATSWVELNYLLVIAVLILQAVEAPFCLLLCLAAGRASSASLCQVCAAWSISAPVDLAKLC